ncbi:MAG: single-stranded DNA-binding protein [Candidatus Eisenbacteria bacterium]|nr:single-stranded DNA-binding protein [Candidatus Eisenbacteria bacterium]
MMNVRLPSLNRVTLAGRLTRDPEVRYTPAGHAVATLALAINRPYKDQAGTWQEETCYVSVVAWDRQAEAAGQQLKKGSSLLVEGRLTSRSWETPEGQKRQVLEVRAERLQFLDRPADADAPGGAAHLPDDPAGGTELPF